MKRLILLCSSAMLLTTVSCVNSLDDYNVNPKVAVTVPGVTLVSNAERNLARTLESSNVNLNVFRLITQYWTETTYTDETRYDFNTRPIPGTFWTALYRDVLSDLEEAKRVIKADAIVDKKVQANQIAAIEILEVQTWMTLVDTFGNVPYTQALNFANPQPKYDDAATIYADLGKRLDAAIASIKTDADVLGSADLLADPSADSWLLYGNSLKLRMALTLADVDAGKSKAMAEQAAPHVLTSNDENIQLNFLSSPPSTNPVWEDLVQNGRKDFVGTNTFITKLTSLNDPRLPAYFKLAKSGKYVGGLIGPVNSYSNFSAPGTSQEDPTQPGVLISYSEVEFLLAEAVERGFAVGGTAESHYNAAVTASIEKWGGTEADAKAYLAQPTVAYATAGSSYKEKIGNQKYIALYDEPVQSWTEYRRLDYPKLATVEDALGAFPLRLPYPVTEQTLNGVNYKSASAAIGGDKQDMKIFWDKF